MKNSTQHATHIQHASHPNHAKHGGGVYANAFKRIQDFVTALLLLLAFSPLIVVITLAMIASGGSPIFRHVRVGRNHKPFNCYKFRTMRLDSARLLRFALRTDPEGAETWRTEQKLGDDPRVTVLGRFLRKTSLDELPQLINVLKGDMSMVGPRPVTEAELWRYGANLPLYLSVRPGLTGPWQVNGRGQTTYAERVEMDCAYVRRITLLKDMILMLQTATVFFRWSGR